MTSLLVLAIIFAVVDDTVIVGGEFVSNAALLRITEYVKTCQVLMRDILDGATRI